MYRVRFTEDVHTEIGRVDEGTEASALRTTDVDDGRVTLVDLGDGVTVNVPTEALENLDA